MFNNIGNVRSRSKKIDTSKSIVNTLYFITSANRDKIDLNGKMSLTSNKKKIFSKNKNSFFSRYLNVFEFIRF